MGRSPDNGAQGGIPSTPWLPEEFLSLNGREGSILQDNFYQARLNGVPRSVGGPDGEEQGGRKAIWGWKAGHSEGKEGNMLIISIQISLLWSKTLIFFFFSMK